VGENQPKERWRRERREGKKSIERIGKARREVAMDRFSRE
jgi:hypothetical protein